ncbi:MAG: quinone oxidoreductase family protein [Sphingorhabdus sp.]
MAHMVELTQHGGPESIQWIERDLPPPGQGEVCMRNTAIGLNFIDTYHRTGLYPINLPSGLGMEAAGVVEAIGEGVNDLAVGDRICTFGPVLGAYSTERNIAATHLFRTPDTIDDEIAAAALLKACTVEFLVERCARVEPGWPVLVHAAAGGVGMILVQWLKAIGACVIGTVSTEAKADLVRAAGADHVLLTSHTNMATEVRALTGGTGVKVVFDGVGADTWEVSLESCAPRALIVSFGNASGPVAGVNLATLAAKGGLFVTRPSLFHYYADSAEREAGAARMFEMIATGKIGITIGQRYPLSEVARAHRDLEARKTSGSTILLP